MFFSSQINSAVSKNMRDGRTDGARTDRWTNGRTDRPSYRDTWTHLKSVLRRFLGYNGSQCCPRDPFSLSGFIAELRYGETAYKNYTINNNNNNLNDSFSSSSSFYSSPSFFLGAEEPFWFWLTVVFIYLASFLRLCQLSLKEILWKYFFHGFRPLEIVDVTGLTKFEGHLDRQKERQADR